MINEGNNSLGNGVLFTCPMSSITPIIRPVGDLCNMKCSYCYYNSTDQSFDSSRIMSEGVLTAFISQFLELAGDEATIVWHGGEPLLAGIDFYMKVIELEKKYKRKKQIIKNNIQTNGVLLNEKWASFFKENDFHIGMSLDGIQCVHDKFRKNINGDSSFNQVIAAIELLRHYNIEPGILQTVTKYSLTFLKDSFSYFVDTLKIKKWGVNVYNNKGNTNPLMINQSLSNDDFYYLYKTLFDLWVERGDSTIEIREIDNFVSGILGRYSGICHNSGICSSFISVNSEGDITPTCEDFFDFNYLKRDNNITTKELLDILNGQQRISFSEVINYVPDECKRCKWHSGCFNGCTMQRDEDNKYIYCEGRKKIYSYIWKFLKNQINN